MVCGDRIIKGNAGIGMQRADFNADFVAANGGNNGLHRFQGKARLVFDAATVFVVALVAGIGEELLRQIAIGGVEFDAIESGFNGIFCRLGVIGNDLPDFGAREFSRGFVIFRPLRGEVFDAFDVNGNGGWRAWQNAIAVYGMGDAAGMPELRVNQPAFFVYGGGNFLPGGDLRILK